MPKRMRNLSDSCDMLNDHARRFKANFMSPWMKNTYRSTNSMTFMSMPGKLALRFADSSTILKDTRNARTRIKVKKIKKLVQSSRFTVEIGNPHEMQTPTPEP